MSGVSSMNRWLSSSLLRIKSSLLGCKPALVLTKPRRNKTQGSRMSLCLTFPSTCLLLRSDGAPAWCYTWVPSCAPSNTGLPQPCLCLDPHSCYGEQHTTTWAKERRSASDPDKLLLSFAYITLGLGESRLSLKLNNHFPNPTLACAGSSPYPIWSFPPVFQDRRSHFMLSFWLLLCVSQFYLIIWFLLCMGLLLPVPSWLLLL